MDANTRGETRMIILLLISSFLCVSGIVIEMFNADRAFHSKFGCIGVLVISIGVIGMSVSGISMAYTCETDGAEYCEAKE